jgi:signal transduction histidine kinase
MNGQGVIVKIDYRETNLSEYILRGGSWIILLLLDQVAAIILQAFRPFIHYHLLSIAIAVVILLLVSTMGRKPVMRDLQEICLYDVGVQLYGLVCFGHGYPMASFVMLANAVLILKFMRIFWLAKDDASCLIAWPVFGVIGYLGRKKRQLDLPLLAKLKIYGAIIISIPCGALYRDYLQNQGLLPFLIISILLAVVYIRPLIAHLDTQQEQLRTTMEELGAARVRAELAEVMAAQAAQLVVKNEEMNHLNLELEKVNHELSMRNDDLMMANCAIDAKNVELARQSRVVEQANHDIMPLMNMIHELTQLAMEVDTIERKHEILQQVIDCNATMGERMERLIGVRRIKTHKERSIYSAVHLSEVIDMLDLPFCRMAEKRGGSFAVKGTYHRKVWSNAEYLDRIISNLIKNAIVHNPPGTHVRLLVTLRRNACIIRIFDNGNGIPEAGGTRRYQNFTDLVQRVAARADLPAGEANSTTTSVATSFTTDSSHGIGLQSVAALCKELGLELRLYSRFRLGAIFEIWLQLAA